MSEERFNISNRRLVYLVSLKCAEKIQRMSTKLARLFQYSRSLLPIR